MEEQIRLSASGRPLRADRKALVSWALFDWASTPFATLIVTFVFPAYFARAVVGDEVRGQALWGYAIGSAGLAIAVLSPLLGAIADAGGRRKPWLFAFSVLCIAACALLWFVAPDRAFVNLAIVLAAIANVSYTSATVFNNALLPDLVPEERVGRLSGWAWGLGYSGGLAALVLVLFVFMQHEFSWLDRARAEHVRIVGPLVALWFVLFMWPLFLWTPDRAASGLSLAAAIREGLATLKISLRRLGAQKNILRFLLAQMLYADALVAVFAFGGIYAAGAFGMSLAQVTAFGILLNVTAGFGAFAFAWVDDWIGSRRTILIALGGLVVTASLAVLVHDRAWFWIVGAALGLFVGPAQAAGRSFMARLAPKGEETEFFGLFALSNRATAFLGPALVGTVTALSGSQRAGLASIILLFVAGAALLWRVSEPRVKLTTP
ncbi:MAG TPA: MFS transporter [Rhizomicrobium sp.]|nr:MFS transporter [Rhizomicrobium sp.]